MRIAALYDIHGNLPALDAVLRDADAAGADRILIGGDVAYGPLVPDTLDRLMALGDRALWLRGNADRELLEFQALGHTRQPVAPEIQQALVWEAQRLGPHHWNWLRALPQQQRVEVTGLGATLFCHGSPRSDEEIITALTSPERLGRVLAGVNEQLVVCGHTHVQFDHSWPGRRIVNAGSVGLPYQAPGAYWALLGDRVELRRTAYDQRQAAALFRASGHPLCESFARALEQPVTAEDASRLFEQRALEQEQGKASQD
ncbi:metallophosphatase family protein [Deinococcus sp. HMF7604]|uniref:metallophosphoesterase family protein n=1 Tax=Deinococcus betulae TaxID=2873312 RepID=UPI001CCB38F2|nr:metallophosphoesterase family protein [Deinococcus betulae]MBZ9751427.1 metallophosphatase family protein [Deinococcus betulae]